MSAKKHKEPGNLERKASRFEGPGKLVFTELRASRLQVEYETHSIWTRICVKVRCGDQDAVSTAITETAEHGVNPVYRDTLEVSDISFPPERCELAVILEHDIILGLVRLSESRIVEISTDDGVGMERIIDAEDGSWRGSLSFRLAWVKDSPFKSHKLREPWEVLRYLIMLTQSITWPIEGPLDLAIDGLFSASEKINKWIASLPAVQFYGYVIAVFSVGAVLSLAAWVPVLVLLCPVSFSTVLMASLVLAALGLPFFLVSAWLIFCSAPVQSRLVHPLVVNALKNDVIRSFVVQQ